MILHQAHVPGDPYGAQVILLRVIEPPAIGVGMNLDLVEVEPCTQEAESLLSAMQTGLRYTDCDMGNEAD